jgi:hypothetical protein
VTQRGRAAAARRWPGEWRAFKLLRTLALRTIGGATYFTADDVLTVTEACIKTVASLERVPMVVRGPLSPIGIGPGEDRRMQAETRRMMVNARLIDLCARHHVEYVGSEATIGQNAWRELSRRDGIHLNAVGHRGRGEAEGRAMVAAWGLPPAGRNEG